MNTIAEIIAAKNYFICETRAVRLLGRVLTEANREWLRRQLTAEILHPKTRRIYRHADVAALARKLAAGSTRLN